MADERAVERLAELEQRLSKLEGGGGGGKDFWDKFQVLASLLIPAAVTFAGYYFANAMADAQRQAEDYRTQATQVVAEASTRVSQAELISTFMKSLLSNDRAEKNLAIRAVILALPEEGPQLVAAIQWSSADAETRNVAQAALVERRDKLVQDLHASDEPARNHAAQALMLGFRRDPELVQKIAAEAEKHPEDREGIVQSAEVLKSVSSEQIQKNPDGLRRLEKVAERHDEKARSLFVQLKQRSDPFAPTATRHE